jgi:hypothetical protein
MSNPETIHRFLVALAPAPCCDHCIARRTEIAASQVNPIAIAFGLTTDFQRARGKCTVCQRRKLVTRFGDGRG